MPDLRAALVLAASHPHAARWIIGWIVVLVLVAVGVYLARRPRGPR